jgi:Flp pilus assembly pilin Flp
MLKLYVKSLHLLDILKDEVGQDSVEYAILIGIIATGVIASVKTINTFVTTQFSTLAGDL